MMIPRVLRDRYEALKMLDIAYELADRMKKNGKSGGAEAQFLTKKIEEIERGLEDGEEEAEQVINQTKDDFKVWIALRLRYMHDAHTWEEIADMLGTSSESIKTRCIRAFQKISEKTEEKANDYTQRS